MRCLVLVAAAIAVLCLGACDSVLSDRATIHHTQEKL